MHVETTRNDLVIDPRIIPDRLFDIKFVFEDHLRRKIWDKTYGEIPLATVYKSFQ